MEEVELKSKEYVDEHVFHEDIKSTLHQCYYDGFTDGMDYINHNCNYEIIYKTNVGVVTTIKSSLEEVASHLACIDDIEWITIIKNN